MMPQGVADYMRMSERLPGNGPGSVRPACVSRPINSRAYQLLGSSRQVMLLI